MKEYKCEICNEEFADSGNLKIHYLQIHNKGKKTCNFCEKVFRKLTDLKTHMLTHTKEKVDKCRLGSEDFRSSVSLEMHITRVHSLEKPFQSQYSAQNFNCKSKFINRGEVHQGEIQKSRLCTTLIGQDCLRPCHVRLVRLTHSNIYFK